MPNVTSVWDFSPGETLTAAKLDDVNCGIHVFSGTATRDAAYGGSGERALSEGEFAYLADTNTTQYYDGAAWQTVGGGLTLIKTQTIGTAVSSVTVTNAFSATYDNYFVTVSGGVGSTVSGGTLTLGATTTGYYFAGTYVTYPSATVNGYRVSNGAGWSDVINTSTNNVDGQFFLRNPYLAKNTTINYEIAVSDATSYALQAGGYLANTTSYTDFTITWTPGTATGGTIRVYGYQNS